MDIAVETAFSQYVKLLSIKNFVTFLIIIFFYRLIKDVVVPDLHLLIQILLWIITAANFRVFSLVSSLMRTESSGNNINLKTLFYSTFWITGMLMLYQTNILDEKISTDIIMFLLPLPVLLVLRIPQAALAMLCIILFIITQITATAKYIPAAENFAMASYSFLVASIITMIFDVVKNPRTS